MVMSLVRIMLMMMILVRMGEVETYTSLAPVGALTQEYKGLLVVSKVFIDYLLVTLIKHCWS